MNFQHNKSFTVIELIIVMAIIALLTSFATINLMYAKHRVTLDTSLTLLLSDIKQQQLKAMIGDRENRSVNDSYGLHFNQDGYTLFHGPSYSSSEPSNFTVKLGESIEFSNIMFPDANLIFNTLNGEVMNFTQGQNTVDVKNITNNEKKTITINLYGIITQVN